MSDEEETSFGKFEWSDSMSVGNGAIDGDHKAFLGLVNILSEVQSLDARELVMESALLILQEYVMGHFLREEKALAKVGYPRLSGHIHKHVQFRARVQAIAALYNKGTKSAVEGLPELVVGWLRNHILTEDMEFSHWISDGVVDRRPLVYLAIEAEELNKDGRYDLLMP